MIVRPLGCGLRERVYKRRYHAPTSGQRDTNPGNQGKEGDFRRGWRLESACLCVSVSVSRSPLAMGQNKYSITRSPVTPIPRTSLTPPFPPRLLLPPACTRQRTHQVRVRIGRDPERALFLCGRTGTSPAPWHVEPIDSLCE